MIHMSHSHCPILFTITQPSNGANPPTNLTEYKGHPASSKKKVLFIACIIEQKRVQLIIIKLPGEVVGEENVGENVGVDPEGNIE